MVVSARAFAVVFVMVLPAFGGSPHVPPRNYGERATVILGEEAVVLAKATEAALTHLRKRSPKASLAAYFATIERKGPSVWVVTWMLNDIDARGGGIEVSLDATGSKVLGVVDLE